MYEHSGVFLLVSCMSHCLNRDKMKYDFQEGPQPYKKIFLALTSFLFFCKDRTYCCFVFVCVNNGCIAEVMKNKLDCDCDDPRLSFVSKMWEAIKSRGYIVLLPYHRSTQLSIAFVDTNICFGMECI